MSVVAVAGGTASVGRAIVEAIVAQGSHEVLVLTRKVPELSEKPGIKYAAVDYSSIESIIELLENRKVDTVISALGGLATPQIEERLIQAADRSAVTKRFIPSIFGVRYPPEQRAFPAATMKILAIEALQKTKLQWTAICNGFFLDYWGMPKLESYLKPMTLVIDMAAKAAAIPGSGNTPISFTYSGDVGKYTAALLTLDHWDEETYVIGDKITWNEFLRLAEDARGEKFEVTHDSPELLHSGMVTELPSHVHSYPFFPKEALQGMLATFGILFDQGLFDFPDDRVVNRRFPGIKPLTAKDVLEIGWKD